MPRCPTVLEKLPYSRPEWSNRHARLRHLKQLLKKFLTVIFAYLVHWRKDVQSGHTKNPTVWLHASAATHKKRCCGKMPLHTASGRLVTDGDYQSASQNIGLIRLIFVTSKVSINGIRNVTTVNNSFFVSYVKSMANSSSLCRTVPRHTQCVKQPSCL